MRRQVVLALALAFGAGVAVWWVAKDSAARRPPTPAGAPRAETILIVRQLDCRRETHSLRVKGVNDPNLKARYAEGNPDADWWIEIGGAVYICELTRAPSR